MKIRVIVPIYNERAMLPGFLRYYEKVADSIVIWDNGSTDGSLEIAKNHPLVDLRTFETESYDELSVQSVLLQSKGESLDYDWCMFPDCDELLVMRDGGDLRKYLENVKEDVIRAKGYCLVHHEDESPFDGKRPWFGQRRFGWQDVLYSKAIILRPGASLTFTPGKHDVAIEDKLKVAVKEDSGIVLVHFELVDFYLWYYRKMRRPISEKNRQKGWCTDRFGKDTPTYHRIWGDALRKSRFLDEEVPVLRGS